jgi:glutathione S-transferase
MITLVRFPSAFGVPNPSPFGMKLDILLQMSGLPYKSEINGDPRSAPKGKLPMIIDGTQRIGDSTLIQHYLEQKYNINFNVGLNSRDLAITHAISRMCEERLYWCIVYSRWIDNDNWPIVRDAFFTGLPPVIRTIVPAVLRKKMLRDVQGHGLARHSAAEIYQFAAADIAALATLLGDKQFMMADHPTAVDAVVYAHIASLLVTALKNPMLEMVQSQPNLVAYAARCKALWYADFK